MVDGDMPLTLVIDVVGRTGEAYVDLPGHTGSWSPAQTVTINALPFHLDIDIAMPCDMRVDEAKAVRIRATVSNSKLSSAAFTWVDVPDTTAVDYDVRGALVPDVVLVGPELGGSPDDAYVQDDGCAVSGTQCVQVGGHRYRSIGRLVDVGMLKASHDQPGECAAP